MNFLDTYDITRSTTPNPQDQQQQPSLNEEVTQVIGQLGRFWGGFKKQSQTALETARKDLTQVVAQAQKELSKLTVAEAETGQQGATLRGTTESTAALAGPSANRTSVELGGSTEVTDEETRGADALATASSSSSGSSSTNIPQTLFSRLQAALPPNIVATVQNNIPESLKHASENLKHASENVDLNQIRTTMLSELQRVQGVTLAQAEEYAHKSEVLLREAVKEAGEVLRDAVKVIPPEAQASGSGSGLIWDGSDMWMLPALSGETSDPSRNQDGGSGFSKVPETHSAVASRAEALLRRLKSDPSIIQHDPESEEGVKDQYFAWKEKEVDALDGGIEGAEWKAKVDAALQATADGQSLKQLEETLVPSEMTESAFWLRFFFRTYQIRSEEEKRKALLQSTTTENDEDFSWEDEEDEAGSPSTLTKPLQSTASDKGKSTHLVVPPSAPANGGTTSSRVSSEDSFDMVSSANASVAGDEKPVKAKNEDSDGDSDWE